MFVCCSSLLSSLLFGVRLPNKASSFAASFEFHVTVHVSGSTFPAGCMCILLATEWRKHRLCQSVCVGQLASVLLVQEQNPKAVSKVSSRVISQRIRARRRSWGVCGGAAGSRLRLGLATAQISRRTVRGRFAIAPRFACSTDRIPFFIPSLVHIFASDNGSWQRCAPFLAWLTSVHAASDVSAGVSFRHPGQPKYISPRSADVILSDIRPIKFNIEALGCLNVLLDEILTSIIVAAHALTTERLKLGLLKVLPTTLGKEALLEAEVELRAYWERTNASRPGSAQTAAENAPDQDFNVQWAVEVRPFGYCFFSLSR